MYALSPRSASVLVQRSSQRKTPGVRTLGCVTREHAQHVADTDVKQTARREFLASLATTQAILTLWEPEAAQAEPSSAIVGPEASSSASKVPELVKFFDADWEVQVPSDWLEIEVPQQQRKYEDVGPTPERSPLRVRFDSPDGVATFSVLVRNAQSIKRTLLQAIDISAYGDIKEAAQVLVPPGSRVLKTTVFQEPIPPRETPLGIVELPPRNYYTYEFVTNNALRVILTAGLYKGKVYVCGVTTPADRFDTYATAAKLSVTSFRIRTI